MARRSCNERKAEEKVRDEYSGLQPPPERKGKSMHILIILALSRSSSRNKRRSKIGGIGKERKKKAAKAVPSESVSKIVRYEEARRERRF
jgi:hypothetical protein